jgi:simple sugar transport system permease protein
MNFNDLKINFIRFILSILIIFFLLLSFGINPLDVTNALFIGSFGSFEKIIRTILVWVPISLASIALIYTFSSGMWNIGIEGQIIMGAIGATVIARSFLGDTFISPYIQLFMALAFGGFWGLICAILKVKGGVHEIFSGLGLDFVASGIAIYLIIGPWKRKGIASTSGTDIFHENSWIPTVGNLDFPIFLVIVVTLVYVFTFVLLSHTSFGLRLKATGINFFATNRFNFSSERYIIYSFIIAGALAGIAGFSQVSGSYHKLVPTISGGFGFLSILLVLICSRNIFLTFIISFLFAALIVGGSQLQIKLDLDHSLVGIIQASFVLTWLILQRVNLEKKILNIFSKVLTK